MVEKIGRSGYRIVQLYDERPASSLAILAILAHLVVWCLLLQSGHGWFINFGHMLT